MDEKTTRVMIENLARNMNRRTFLKRACNTAFLSIAALAAGSTKLPETTKAPKAFGAANRPSSTLPSTPQSGNLISLTITRRATGETYTFVPDQSSDESNLVLRTMAELPDGQAMPILANLPLSVTEGISLVPKLRGPDFDQVELYTFADQSGAIAPISLSVNQEYGATDEDITYTGTYVNEINESYEYVATTSTNTAPTAPSAPAVPVIVVLVGIAAALCALVIIIEAFTVDCDRRCITVCAGRKVQTCTSRVHVGFGSYFRPVCEKECIVSCYC